MTAAVIIAGLLPILWSHGAGADVMKRIATPMVGGVITCRSLGCKLCIINSSVSRAAAHPRKRGATPAKTHAKTGNKSPEV